MTPFITAARTWPMTIGPAPMTMIFFKSSRFFDADPSAHAKNAGADLTVPLPLEDVLASGAATHTICWWLPPVWCPPMRRWRRPRALRACTVDGKGLPTRLWLCSIAWLFIKGQSRLWENLTRPWRCKKWWRTAANSTTQRHVTKRNVLGSCCGT